MAFSLFGKKEEESIIGVDLGASSVKLVELRPVKHQMQLVTYGFSEGKIDLPADEEGKPILINPDRKIINGSRVR